MLMVQCGILSSLADVDFYFERYQMAEMCNDAGL